MQEIIRSAMPCTLLLQQLSAEASGEKPRMNFLKICTARTTAWFCNSPSGIELQSNEWDAMDELNHVLTMTKTYKKYNVFLKHLLTKANSKWHRYEATMKGEEDRLTLDHFQGEDREVKEASAGASGMHSDNNEQGAKFAPLVDDEKIGQESISGLRGGRSSKGKPYKTNRKYCKVCDDVENPFRSATIDDVRRHQNTDHGIYWQCNDPFNNCSSKGALYQGIKEVKAHMRQDPQHKLRLTENKWHVRRRTVPMSMVYDIELLSTQHGSKKKGARR
jgi:hypothetical protein